MKIIISILVVLVIATFSFANEWVYSDTSPQIQRLQNSILCPVEVTIVKKIGRPDQYKYKTVKIPDVGQTITQDRSVWIEANKELMSEYLYGDVWYVVTQILDGHGAAIKTAADAKLTEAKKPMPTAESAKE